MNIEIELFISMKNKMKTKQIMPWNLRIGQFLQQYDSEGKPEFWEILSIKKRMGIFTGKPIWTVRTNNPLYSLSIFHGKGRTLPATKATIKIN